MARVNTVIRARAKQLMDLMSSRRCPDEFVHELGSVVGLSDDLPLTEYLTTPDQWRAAIDAASVVWKEKGSQPATRNLVRFLTAGARHSIIDWFGYRTLAGLSGFPWYGTSDDGEYITHIHVEDADGSLDRDAAMTAIETNLNIGEQAVVSFVHFMENFHELWRWTQAGNVTLGTNRVTLSPGEIGMTGVDTSGWDAAAHVWIAYIDTADTASFAFRWNDTTDDGYFVSITQGPATGTGLVELWRSIAGVPASVASAAADIRGFPAPATGTLTAVAGAALFDGETFTLPDGVGQTGVFEFDDDGAVTPGNIAVPFDATMSADQVAVAVETAINNNTIGLRIGASFAGAGVVDLTHDLETVLGNQATSESVVAAGFSLTNMAGAVGPEGMRLDVQTFPTLPGPGLDIKVVVDGVHAFTYNDASPIGVGRNGMVTVGANVADFLYHEVVPLTGQDIRTLP
jgi:hypothetical protein